jgi:hypothetical protein
MCHADGAVEADDLAVEHGVFDDVLHQGGELGRITEARGVRDLPSEGVTGLVSNRPGAMEGTRMRCWASSRAAGRVRAATPPWDAA